MPFMATYMQFTRLNCLLCLLCLFNYTCIVNLVAIYTTLGVCAIHERVPDTTLTPVDWRFVHRAKTFILTLDQEQLNCTELCVSWPNHRSKTFF